MSRFNVAADVHPRNADHRRGADRCTVRFNVAADVHPRNADDSLRPKNLVRRFNVAADVHPRNERKGVEERQPTEASMWPRMFIRGMLGSVSELLFTFLAGWNKLSGTEFAFG